MQPGQSTVPDGGKGARDFAYETGSAQCCRMFQAAAGIPAWVLTELQGLSQQVRPQLIEVA